MESMVFDESDLFVMEKREEFRDVIAYEMGLRPVFKMKQEWYKWVKKNVKFGDSDISGWEIQEVEVEGEVPEKPSREEIDEYLIRENEWIAEQLFRSRGWDKFFVFCKDRGMDEFIEAKVPCEGADRQCRMECPKFGWRCPYACY